MTPKTTQCPKCETTFRVSDAQLQVAKGKVRCGSCLHVFRADEHWVGESTRGATLAKAPPPAAKTPGKFSFDQSAIDGGSTKKGSSLPPPAVNTMGEIRAIVIPPKPAPSKAVDDDNLISDDPSQDDVKLASDTVEVRAVTEDDYSDLFTNLDDLKDGDSFDTTDFDAIDDKSSTTKATSKKVIGGAADESWAKDILDEMDDDSEERAAHMKSVFSADSRDNVFADDGHVKKKKEGVRDGFVSGNRTADEDALSFLKPTAPPSLSRTELLSKIEPAPVEMSWHVSGGEWLGTLLWAGLCCLAGFILFIQYAWVVFDERAREQAYRPYYAAACDVLGCELPDVYNPDAIRSSNLVVRTDPANKNILAVDVILVNAAPYDQPFPELELYFSNLDNFSVASRRFTPKEYLAGEMAGKKVMPSQKSIHISLQLVDPGEKAVNYRIQVSNRKPVNS